MPSATAHFLVGASLALPATKSPRLTAILPPWAIPVSAGLLSTIPDFDMAWKRLFRHVPSDLVAHRGIFHSPFFLVVLAGILAAVVARRYLRRGFMLLWLVWAGCMVTHPLLDAMTDGDSRGVMLLFPFSSARLHFAWRPLQTNGWTGGFLEHALHLRPSEIPFCFGACLIGLAGLVIWQKKADAQERLA